MTDLGDLGLSEYEERAYRALLDIGPATAKELSSASDVPMGRIYDVLNGIESRRLVRSQTASRPKKYAAVEPETALERLLEAKRAELRREEEQYERLVEQLAGELDGSRPAGNEQFWTAALGPEETLTLFLERIDAADERVTMVASAPSGFELGELTERVGDHLEDAIDRGVVVEILVSRDLAESVSREIGERYERLAALDGFEVRITDEVRGSFTVFDLAEVCVEVPNPFDPGETFALINLQEPSFAADANGAIEPKWEDATPL